MLALMASATVNANELQLVGETRLKFMFWSVYDARLYTDNGQYEEGKRPLRLSLQYLLDIESEALVSRTRDEWDTQSLSHPRQEQWLQQLAGMWPDITEKDEITLHVDADNLSTFYFNGEVLGTIEDPEFGQHFLAIWLSPNTTRPDMRLALLGKDD